jgi:hypothetical protein
MLRIRLVLRRSLYSTTNLQTQEPHLHGTEQHYCYPSFSDFVAGRMRNLKHKTMFQEWEAIESQSLLETVRRLEEDS